MRRLEGKLQIKVSGYKEDKRSIGQENYKGERTKRSCVLIEEADGQDKDKGLIGLA